MIVHIGNPYGLICNHLIDRFVTVDDLYEPTDDGAASKVRKQL